MHTSLPWQREIYNKCLSLSFFSSNLNCSISFFTYCEYRKQLYTTALQNMALFISNISSWAGYMYISLSCISWPFVYVYKIDELRSSIVIPTVEMFLKSIVFSATSGIHLYYRSQTIWHLGILSLFTSIGMTRQKRTKNCQPSFEESCLSQSRPFEE